MLARAPVFLPIFELESTPVALGDLVREDESDP